MISKLLFLFCFFNLAMGQTINKKKGLDKKNLPILKITINKQEILKLADEGGSAGSLYETQLNEISEFLCWILEYKRPFIKESLKDFDKTKLSCYLTPVHFVNAVLKDSNNGHLSAVTLNDHTSPTGYRTFFNITSWQSFFDQQSGEIKESIAENIFELIFHERLLGAGEADQDKSLSRFLNVDLQVWKAWKRGQFAAIPIIEKSPAVTEVEYQESLDDKELTTIYMYERGLSNLQLNQDYTPFIGNMDPIRKHVSNVQEQYKEKCWVGLDEAKLKIKKEIETTIKRSFPSKKIQVNVSGDLSEKPLILANYPTKSYPARLYDRDGRPKYIPIASGGCADLSVKVKIPDVPKKRIKKIKLKSIRSGAYSHNRLNLTTKNNSYLGKLTSIKIDPAASLTYDAAFQDYKHKCQSFKQEAEKKYKASGKFLFATCEYIYRPEGISSPLLSLFPLSAFPRMYSKEVKKAHGFINVDTYFEAEGFIFVLEDDLSK